MTAIQYREANISDVPAMARVRSGEWGTEDYWKMRISGYLKSELHPQQALPRRILYIALNSEITVGFVAGHLSLRFECDGELQWLNIIPQYQRMGIATALLRLLAQWFLENKALRICVDVDPDNTIAQRFYMKNGAAYLNKHWLVWNDISKVFEDPV